MPSKASKKPKTTRKQRKAAENTSGYGDCSGSKANTETTAVEYLENPIQSDADKNQYRVIKLSNGLTATLISSLKNDSPKDEKDKPEDADNDEKCKPDRGVSTKPENGFKWFGASTDKAKMDTVVVTCSLAINVGSFSDPADGPNISHLLGNLILTSSKKYPQNNSFANFLIKNGSCVKGYRKYEFTWFGFHIPLSEASEAMDRFTSSFVDPIFRREALLAENRAIYEARIEHEINRMIVDPSASVVYGIAFSTKGHPMCKTAHCEPERSSKANLNLLEEAQKYMKRHYSAHRMTLVLKADMPLDSLEQCAKTYFTRIPNNGLPPTDLSSYSYTRCFDTPAFNLLYVIKTPDTANSMIVLDWSMPPARGFYRSKPHQYLVWLLQSRGQGSLLFYLREKKWCNNMESGVGKSDFQDNSVYSLFRITLDLTEEGVFKQKEILDVVYSYVNFLKLGGTQKRIYEEIRQIKKALFRVKDEDDRYSYYEELCKNMHLYPSVHYLTGSFLFYDYDPSAIELCLNCMAPEKANTKFYGKNMTGLRPSSLPDHGDREHVVLEKIRIPDDWIKDWKKISPLPCFQLPEPNIFCPDDFTLVPVPKNSPQYPVKIHSDSLSETWHKLDDKFRQPVCFIVQYYTTTAALNSAESAVMIELFAKLLQTMTCDALHPASVCGMRYEISACTYGISISANGFNQVMPILMHMLTEFIGDFPRVLTEELLDLAKKSQIQAYWDQCADLLAIDVQYSILHPPRWSNVDKLAAIPGITFKKFKNFVKHYTDRVYVQTLIQGNIGASDALAMVENCIRLSNCRPFPPNTRPRRGANAIPRGYHCCRLQNLHPKFSGCSVINFYQFGERTITMMAGISVLMMIVKNPLFMIMRIRDNIDGYGVDLHRDHSHLLGYSASLVIPGFDATVGAVELRIERYRRALCKMLREFTSDEWTLVKEFFCRLCRRDVDDIADEMTRNWVEIASRWYIFDRHIREAEIIDRLDIEDLQRLIISLITTGPTTRKLSVQTVGHAEYRGKERQMTGKFIPPLSEVKLKYLTGSLADEEETDVHYITDIASFKQTLRTYVIDSPVV